MAATSLLRAGTPTTRVTVVEVGQRRRRDQVSVAAAGLVPLLPAGGHGWGEAGVCSGVLCRRRIAAAADGRDSDRNGDSSVKEQPSNGPGWEWDKLSFVDDEAPGPRWISGLFPKERRKPEFLRDWLSEADPGLNQSLISSGTTISQLFDQDKWENHRSMKRYFRDLKLMPKSTVLRRIFRPCLIVTLIGLFVCCWNTWGVPAVCAHLTHIAAAHITLGMGTMTHSLLGAAISLLLVFRTNSCHARFCEGRLLWGRAVAVARRWSMLMSMGVPIEHRAKSKDYIKVWAVVLKSHLRSGRTRTGASNDPTAYRDDPSEYVRSVLPPREAAFVLQQRNKPLVVLGYMTAILNHIIPSLSYTTHAKIQEVLDELGGIAGGCERLLSTPIPLSYTRHCTRSLMIWLLTAPFALYHHCGFMMVPMLFFMSFLMLGIDELAAQIEEPFSILPLTPLVEVIKRETDELFDIAPALMAATDPTLSEDTWQVGMAEHPNRSHNGHV